MSLDVQLNPPGSNALLDLSTELLWQIIDELSPAHVWILRLVCRRFRVAAHREFISSFDYQLELSEHGLQVLDGNSRSAGLRHDLDWITFRRIDCHRREVCKYCGRGSEAAYQTCSDPASSYAWCLEELNSARRTLQCLSQPPKLEFLDINFWDTTPPARYRNYNGHRVSYEEQYRLEAEAPEANSNTQFFAAILRGVSAGLISPQWLAAYKIQLDHHSVDQLLPLDDHDILDSIAGLRLHILGFDTGIGSPTTYSNGHRGLARLLARLPNLSNLHLRICNCGEHGQQRSSVNNEHRSYGFRVMNHLSQSRSLPHQRHVELYSTIVSAELLTRLLRSTKSSLKTLKLRNSLLVGQASGQPGSVSEMLKVLAVISEECLTLDCLLLSDIQLIDRNLSLTFQWYDAFKQRLLPLYTTGAVRRRPSLEQLDLHPDRNYSHTLLLTGMYQIVRATTDLHGSISVSSSN